MINELRKIVNIKIAETENLLVLERLKYIENILKDDSIFFKITLEEAYSIFKDLGIKKENYKEIYENIVLDTIK